MHVLRSHFFSRIISSDILLRNKNLENGNYGNGSLHEYVNLRRVILLQILFLPRTFGKRRSRADGGPVQARIRSEDGRVREGMARSERGMARSERSRTVFGATRRPVNGRHRGDRVDGAARFESAEAEKNFRSSQCLSSPSATGIETSRGRRRSGRISWIPIREGSSRHEGVTHPQWGISGYAGMSGSKGG